MASPTVPGVTYVYDGVVRRVQKMVTANNTTTTTTFAYAVNGNLLAGYGGSAGGTLTQYIVTDATRSTRLVTDATGVPIERLDYAPFGEELYQGIGGRDAIFGNQVYPILSSSHLPVKFTSKERDIETGLDWFERRYFSSAQGRFDSNHRPGANGLLFQPFHYDGASPFGDVTGFAVHSGSVLKSLFETKVLRQKDVLPPVSIPH